MKNSTDTIGNGTRDLPARSAVPQPTAPPRTPMYYKIIRNFDSKKWFIKVYACVHCITECDTVNFILIDIKHGTIYS
jgi:hypothetical protein